MSQDSEHCGSIVGKPAPDFEVMGYFKGDFRSYRLDEYRGKWIVLLFYPLDFTFVCPTEVLSFSRAVDDFRERNAVVLGISVDSQFVHKAWVEGSHEEGGLGGDLEYPLLADIQKTVAYDFGILQSEDGVALRGLFLIDPDGVVMHATINNLPVGRSARETLRTLKAFQYVREHEDQVCPADWEEGSDAMEASPEGMRKYLKSH